MTPEAQRIAIAEACGWSGMSLGSVVGFTPKKKLATVIPDFLNDLNAMHEAEKVLTYEQWSRYVDYLIDGEDSTAPYRGYEAIHATAAQRAEAFLRTIGKWRVGD
jgi:hypothetical protein